MKCKGTSSEAPPFEVCRSDGENTAPDCGDFEVSVDGIQPEICADFEVSKGSNNTALNCADSEVSLDSYQNCEDFGLSLGIPKEFIPKEFIPKGLNHTAQGCEERATLGSSPNNKEP